MADSGAGTAQQEIQAHLDEMLLAANAADTDRFMVAFVQSSDLVFAIQDMTLLGWQALGKIAKRLANPVSPRVICAVSKMVNPSLELTSLGKPRSTAQL